jgi:hypothetical protein
MRAILPVLGLVVSVLSACDIASDASVVTEPVIGERPSLAASNFSEWSEPVNLGAPVNSPCQDQTPTLSKDELALYFLSDRPGGMGNLLPIGCQDNFDLWVAQRASRESAWEMAVNLGPVINTAANEVAPDLSDDGHLLFFSSNRLVGGENFQNDIYVSRRDHTHDDLDWGPPVRLGPGVNTTGFEAGPSYRQSAEDGPANLYFYGGTDNNTGADIYYAAVSRDGETRGTATLVSELSLPGIPDGFPTVRADGREIFFNSGRGGAFDLWVSTRRSVHDAWSTPVNVGPPVNTAFAEFQPNLSFDSRTLLFIAGAGRGGLGRFDIWMSTRTPGGRD